MMQDMNQSFDIQLHDIKPILEIEEYSIYYFSGMIFLSLVLLIGLGYLLYMWIKARNSFNQRKENLRLINELDFTNTKESAYAITSLGYIFKDDSPRHSEMYENLSARLGEYKYKKEVDEFDDEVKGYIELYKGMLDV